jgi:hypothetical protein
MTARTEPAQLARTDAAELTVMTARTELAQLARMDAAEPRS